MIIRIAILFSAVFGNMAPALFGDPGYSLLLARGTLFGALSGKKL